MDGRVETNLGCYYTRCAQMQVVTVVSWYVIKHIELSANLIFVSLYSIPHSLMIPLFLQALDSSK
jgi:hypothetical protein